jgi:catechol 2,3-dioxygenase-like lactoylglutathione lyase family enzyme
MRLDHVAYRVENRDATVEYLMKVFNYKHGADFEINFDDGSSAQCIALTPPEKAHESVHFSMSFPAVGPLVTEYHIAPEIFVSQGTKGSIVERWVKNTPLGKGGIHHLAYSVHNIESRVKQFRNQGIEFLSENIIDCPEDDMRQIFTKPQLLLGGIVIELIERGDRGFCQNSVKELMQSTEEL